MLHGAALLRPFHPRNIGVRDACQIHAHGEPVSGFDLYLELFGMMDDIDGTGSFKNTYKVECNDEDM